MKKLCLLISMGLGLCNSYGQSPLTPAQQDKLALLRRLSEVQQNSRAADPEESYRYKGLFPRGSADTLPVVNEVLSANKPEQSLSLQQYLRTIELYSQGSLMRTLEIRPYAFTALPASPEGNPRYRMDVYKVLSVLGNQYGAEYRDTLDMQYRWEYRADSRDTAWKITSIGLNQYPGKFLRLELSPRLQAAGAFSGQVELNGHSHTLHDGYLLLGNVPANFHYQIEPASDYYLGKTHLHGDSSDLGAYGQYRGNPVRLDFRPRRWYLRGFYQSGSLDEDFAVATNQSDQQAQGRVESSRSGLAIGLDWQRWDNWYSFVELSLAFRQMEARNQLAEYRNVDEDVNDDGGDDYKRNVVVQNYSETISLEGLSAGLNVGLGWRIANSWELQLPVGLQYHLLQSSDYRAQAISSFFGEYSEYGVTLYNVSELGFASDQETENNQGTLNNPSFLSFQAGLQLRYRLSKRWHLYAGGRMELMPELKAAENGEKLDEFDQELQSLYNLRDSWDWQMLGWQAGLQFYF